MVLHIFVVRRPPSNQRLYSNFNDLRLIYKIGFIQHMEVESSFGPLPAKRVEYEPPTTEEVKERG